MTLGRLMSMGMLALVGVGLIRLGDETVNAAKPQIWVGELTIDPRDDDRVFGDKVDSNEDPTTSVYTDYQVSGVVDDNFCIDGLIDGSGLAFFRLDRRQGFSNDLWCHLQVDAWGNSLGYKARLYTLKLQDAVACTPLGGLPLEPPDYTCTLVSPVPPNAGLQPHIWGHTVFKNKATKTAVTFDFTYPDGTAYRVITDDEAPVVTMLPNIRYVRYEGNAHTFGSGLGRRSEDRSRCRSQ
jgi:hypothetical protein